MQSLQLGSAGNADMQILCACGRTCLPAAHMGMLLPGLCYLMCLASQVMIHRLLAGLLEPPPVLQAAAHLEPRPVLQAAAQKVNVTQCQSHERHNHTCVCGLLQPARSHRLSIPCHIQRAYAACRLYTSQIAPVPALTVQFLCLFCDTF
jgi:hypothetical protein